MSGESWSVEFERRAEKDLERLDAPVRRRILSAIEGLVDNPREASLRRLRGRRESRLRVGDWRVLVELDMERRRLLVLRVLPRGRAYKR